MIGGGLAYHVNMTTQLATKPLNPKQTAFVTHYVANGGKGADAAKQAGFGKPYDRSAWRLLQHVEIRREVDRRLAIRANGSEYSLQQWRADLLEDIARAREAGSHSAVMKGRELLGRHIGALSDQRLLDPAETRWFSAFEAAMRASYPTIETSFREVNELESGDNQ